MQSSTTEASYVCHVFWYGTRQENPSEATAAAACVSVGCIKNFCFSAEMAAEQASHYLIRKPKKKEKKKKASSS